MSRRIIVALPAEGVISPDVAVVSPHTNISLPRINEDLLPTPGPN
jgi:hypothetical protein